MFSTLPSIRTSVRTAVRAAVRAAVVGAATLGVLALAASPAAAHVGVTPSSTAAGSSSVLTFSVGHGCDGSPTTSIAISMPEQIVAVTPTLNPGWEVEKVMETLDEPVDNGHGGTYTERVDQVVYTARTPLTDGYRDTFQLSLTLPDEVGATLAFPVLQSCSEGETAWVQTAEQGEEEPEFPAPYIVLTEATDEGHGHGAEAAPGEEVDEEPGTAGLGGSGTVGWIGLVLGALGLGAGGTALARSRR